MFTEVLIRILFTGLLFLIIFACAKEAWYIWVPSKPVLAVFKYNKDGQASAEGGHHFAQLVKHDLMQVEMTHRPYYAAIKDILAGKTTDRYQSITDYARTDLLTPETILPSDVDLPQIAEGLPEVEIEYQGVNLSAILRHLRRTIRQPYEITGSVSERSNEITIYSELRPTLWARGDGWNTFISDISSKNDASHILAVRLFHFFAGQQLHRLYSTATEPEFATFINTLRQYQMYQAMQAQGKEKEATKALAAAREQIKFVNSETRFPFIHDLAARVTYVAGDDEELVKQHLDRYLARLKEYNLPTDRRAESLLAQLETKIASKIPAKIPATAIPGSQRIRPVTPGASIGHVNGTAGTLCCFVKDSAGKVYLLSADHVLGAPEVSMGDKVLQPGSIDGGRIEDQVATVSKWISLKQNAPNKAAGAIAQLREEVDVSYAVPGIGKISGIADSVDLGEELIVVGRTSKLVQARVLNSRVSAQIHMGGGATVAFDDLIGIEPVSRGGDSGAPVLTNDRKLVGMLYAGSTEMTYVIPIQQILAALDVELLTE